MLDVSLFCAAHWFQPRVQDYRDRLANQLSFCVSFAISSSFPSFSALWVSLVSVVLTRGPVHPRLRIDRMVRSRTDLGHWYYTRQLHSNWLSYGPLSRFVEAMRRDPRRRNQPWLSFLYPQTFWFNSSMGTWVRHFNRKRFLVKTICQMDRMQEQWGAERECAFSWKMRGWSSWLMPLLSRDRACDLSRLDWPLPFKLKETSKL